MDFASSGDLMEASCGLKTLDSPVDCDAETALPATPATPSSTYTGSSSTRLLDGRVPGGSSCA